MAETARMQTLRQRAELILQYEQSQSDLERANQQWHPTFLHMLVPLFEEDGEISEDQDGVISFVKRYMDGKLAEQQNALKEQVGN